MLSVVTPAYNEEANLLLLYDRLNLVMNEAGITWEWVVVDDHSRDGTFGVVVRLARHAGNVRGVRFSRNFGPHIAVTCGLDQAAGACAVVLAADLQDPPETLPMLIDRWRAGDQVVWAVRARREGEAASTLLFSRFYYWIMRTIVGIKDMPANGADFFLIDRQVIDAFLRFRESNTSILALITWMGFRQGSITYDKQARIHGKSGWSLSKKLKLVVDSVTSFTFLPIRLMSYTGFITAILGFCYAGLTVLNALLGSPIQGWSSLMVVTLVIGGVQMMMMGVLGEYLWRTLDEARQRPRYLIEASTANLAARTSVGSGTESALRSEAGA